MATVDDDAARQLEPADEALKAFDADAAAAHLSAAIRTFTAAGDRRQAALVCARPGDLYANSVHRAGLGGGGGDGLRRR